VVVKPGPTQDPTPKGRMFLHILLALALGLAGGLTFSTLKAPLPWMLGPMVFNTIAAVLRLPIRGPVRIRPYVVVVIGVLLGAGFTPAVFSQVQAWGVSLAFLAVYLMVSGLIVVPYYRRVAGFDRVTAYFAGMPGGLNEMVVIGRDAGGDDGKIALAHAARIVIVVALVAVWFRLIAGYDLGDRSQFGKSFSDIPWSDLAVLAVCGVAGFFLGRLLKLPAPTLIGPMILSAVAHLTGLSQNPPPKEVVTLAQLFLGTIIGCRFIGSAARDIGRALLVSLGATLIMLTITILFAFVLHGYFKQPTEQVLLAYSPGGLAEMSLVALAMHTEVAYVAIHHVVRITLVVLCAPLVFRLMRRGAKRSE
jgi:membrane AbrB-like protein